MPIKPMTRKGMPGQKMPGQRGPNPLAGRKQQRADPRQQRANQQAARTAMLMGGRSARPIGAKPASQRAWWLKLPIFGNLLAMLFPREGSRVIKRAAPVGPQAMGSIVMARMGNFRRPTSGLSRADRVRIMRARTPSLRPVMANQRNRGKTPGVIKGSR